MKLVFHGGSDQVTGSRHLLETGTHRFLLDCGLFQGHRHEAIAKNSTFPAPASEIDAALISHAHMDHTGGLPLLVKRGFRGKIHCTAATVELSKIMLLDSARIQEEDAKFFNRIHQSEGKIIEPLYTQEDAEQALRQMEPHDFNTPFSIAPNTQVTFLNAGHVLGSAMIHVEIQTPKGIKRVLFTGDLGRKESILMEAPSAPKNVDVLICESTYGGREHPDIGNTETILDEAVSNAAPDDGLILIPTFALERAQEIVYLLERLRRKKEIPPIPIFVDSPMAVDITDVFNNNLDSLSLSNEFKASVAKAGDPFGLASIRYIRDVEESKRLNTLKGPRIILAGSGMCEGGRVLHHLRNSIEKDSTHILIVGYQAEGTLGRRLLDGAKKVKIFGLEHTVRAWVKRLPQFSAHADQSDLIAFTKSISPRPRQVFLVHGEQEAREKLKEALTANGVNNVLLPRFGDQIAI